MQDHTCFCLWHFGEHSPTGEIVEQNHWTKATFTHFMGHNYCLKCFWSTQMLYCYPALGGFSATREKPARASPASDAGFILVSLVSWLWLTAPSHPSKCHIPPEALRARSHGSLMAQWMCIRDDNFPARFKRYKEVIIHGFLCVTKLFRRDCRAIHATQGGVSFFISPAKWSRYPAML